jgi:hypothetical protein
MSDALRYRLIDESAPNALSKLALPPLLVFLVATFFQPWGFVLIVFNAIALGGPFRNREIGLALAPIPLYFCSIALLEGAVRTGLLTITLAPYLFVASVGVGLLLAAFAYVSQARTFELRRYLASFGTRA